MNAIQDTQGYIDRGYMVRGQSVYGVEDGVPFTVVLARRSATVAFALERRMDGAEKAAVKDAMKAEGFRVMLPADAMSVSVKPDRAAPAASVVEAAARIVRAGLAAGVPFSESCAFCGNRGADAFMLCPQQNGRAAGYRSVHQSCVYAAQSEAEQKAARNEGSYISGLVGALLGAIVGALPTVFTIWQFQRIYALICALVPLGAFYGYKLFKGKMNRFSIVSTIIFSLFGAFAIQASLDILDTIVNFGATFAQAVEYMAAYLPVDPDYQAYFFSGFGQVLLCVGLGVVFCSGVFRNTDRGLAARFANMLGTLRLKQGVEPFEPPSAAHEAVADKPL